MLPPRQRQTRPDRDLSIPRTDDDARDAMPRPNRMMTWRKDIALACRQLPIRAGAIA
jgi:hypothetical protein